MKVRVIEPQRFGEGWKKDQIVDMDAEAARVPLEKGYVVLAEENLTPASPVVEPTPPSIEHTVPQTPSDTPKQVVSIGTLNDKPTE